MPLLHNHVYQKFPTNIPGLLFVPSFDQLALNDQDGTLSGEPYGIAEFSLCNQTVLYNLLQDIKPKTILEIGVYNLLEDTPRRKYGDPDCSSTLIIKDYKLPECIYLGVDLKDKRFIEDYDNKMYTIQANSLELSKVYEYMQILQITTIDLLIIDGYHSVSIAFNDWQYTQWLSTNGIVVLHDTNRHPGQMLLFDAVDPTLYHKERFCTEFTDNGIAVFKRLS